MKVMIIGNGGREHALAWKLAQSPSVTKLYAAPGNAGIAKVAECVPISTTDKDILVKFAIENHIDLTIVGPEVPLVEGVVDEFKEAGLKIFGPSKAAALLEGTKKAAKEFMMKYNIPTAAYAEYSNLEEAKAHLADYGFPVVIKADGLAAGKGVVIAQNSQEAEDALNEMMAEKKYGQAGEIVVIEEFLTGIEASVLCLVDGGTITPLESVRDYKRIFDNDEGPNTGGMGTCSPNPDYTDEIAAEVEENVLKPFLRGIKEEGYDYCGLAFIGIMMTKQGVKVLEFNVRFGDPETQSLMVRLESDLLEVLLAVCDKRLKHVELKWSPQKAVTMVLASPGYPEKAVKGLPIKGFENVEEGLVFHAGTKEINGQTVTDGGRVLNLVGYGNTYEEARAICLKNVEMIDFEGKQYRKDIALF